MKLVFNLADSDKAKYFESLKKLHGGSYDDEKKDDPQAINKPKDPKNNPQ